MTKPFFSRPESLRGDEVELPSPTDSRPSFLPSHLDADVAPEVSAESGADAVEVSDSSSDSSTSSSESIDEENFVEKTMPASIHKDTLEELFQHKKSRVLHRPGASAGQLLRGRKCNENYRHLEEGASFRWARCSICFKGEVLTSAPQIADALDSLH